MPSQTLTVQEAATTSERSESTIRRWLREGTLTRHAGPIPPRGGSASIRIDSEELFAHLAMSGQVPRESTAIQPSERVSTEPGVGTEHTPSSVEIEVAVLREQLGSERLRGQVSTLQSELESAQRELMQARHALEDMRRTRDDWRDRYDASEAEQKALRASLQAREGLPWWRKLIGTSSSSTALSGPIGEIPEAK